MMEDLLMVHSVFILNTFVTILGRQVNNPPLQWGHKKLHAFDTRPYFLDAH